MKLPALLKKPFLQKRTPPRPPLTELAPAQGVNSLLGILATFAAPTDPPPGGDAVYRRMQHDSQIKACLNTKKFAVLSRGWEVHPASASVVDAEVAAFVRACLEGMDGSPLDACYDVLDALAVGVSVLEINWKVIADGPWTGRVGLRSLKAKDTSRFVFQTDDFYNLTALRGAAGETFPPDKFLVYAYMPQYAHPLGTSDLRAAYSSWKMKSALLQWWAKYLEKFGLPTVTGTYDASKGYSKSQQADFLSVVSQVHNESALVFPSDMSVKLLETGRSSVAGFDECISYLDRAIAKSILGQTLTSDSTSHTSTYALGAVHFDVLKFYINKLARDLEETVMTRQLIARLVAYNFPPGTPVPTFRLGKLDDDKLAVAGKLIAELVTGNVIAPDEPWIRGYLGLPARKSEE